MAARVREIAKPKSPIQAAINCHVQRLNDSSTYWPIEVYEIWRWSPTQLLPRAIASRISAELRRSLTAAGRRTRAASTFWNIWRARWCWPRRGLFAHWPEWCGIEQSGYYILVVLHFSLFRKLLESKGRIVLAGPTISKGKQNKAIGGYLQGFCWMSRNLEWPNLSQSNEKYSKIRWITHVRPYQSQKSPKTTKTPENHTK